jgi:hypothetical protein
MTLAKSSVRRAQARSDRRPVSTGRLATNAAAAFDAAFAWIARTDGRGDLNRKV